MTARAQLLNELAGCVRHGVSVSFVKRGDGEENCMRGDVGENCDGHPYSLELGCRLREAFAFLETLPSVRIVYFNDQDRYQALIHNGDNQDVLETKRFWEAVRDSERPKIFVGPDRLFRAARMLGASHVRLPLVNAFSAYEATRDCLAQLAARASSSIFIFCAGMPAKVWIADLLKERPSLTCLDAGSAFDPLFVGNTRTGQMPMNEARALYSDWTGVLSGNSLVHSVVFSKDRAMQLDAFLRSMKKFAPEFYPPTVFWMASSPRDAESYRQLIAQNRDCQWVPQVRASFTRDLLGCLETGSLLSALFCDDDVFFRDVPAFEVAPETCFSLRFGDGVGDGCSEGFEKFAPVAPGPVQESRGYSIDGNVHRTEELRAAVKRCATSEPNGLEVEMNHLCAPVVERHARQNCLVGIPHNLVQNVFPGNPNMGGSAAELTERYLSGERIDLDAMDFSHVVDAHQFIPYVFRKRCQ
jgi:hypothetical protein